MNKAVDLITLFAFQEPIKLWTLKNLERKLYLLHLDEKTCTYRRFGLLHSLGAYTSSFADISEYILCAYLLLKTNSEVLFELI